MKALIICLILYLCWIGIYLLWSSVNKHKDDSLNNISSTAKKGDIMGKTKTPERQIQPTSAKENHNEAPDKESITFANKPDNEYPKIVDQEEFDKVFSNDKMEIDIDADYIDEADDELEDIAYYMGAEVKDFATGNGVSFDEMDNLVKVLSEKELRAENLTQAVSTVQKVQDTDIYDAVISGYENGLQKVADMLAKHEDLKSIPDLPTSNFDDFKLTNFL